MASDTEYDELTADLAVLGRSLTAPAPGTGLAAAVMARLSDVPTPMSVSSQQQLGRRVADVFAGAFKGAFKGHRRRAAIVVTATLLALLGTPAVRAAVADWFGFAGVSVRLDPTPGPSVAPSPPTVDGTATLAEARKLVAFEPVVPAALGTPQGVEVSADRRLLSMSWTVQGAGAVRLDQFDGRLDYSFAKTAPGVEFTSVAGSSAIWFEKPHEVVVLNADGTRRTETARLAGHTLIWEYGGTALRLEGDFTRARAIEIASTVTTLP